MKNLYQLKFIRSKLFLFIFINQKNKFNKYFYNFSENISFIIILFSSFSLILHKIHLKKRQAKIFNQKFKRES
jgi:hypothetical protein